jgi:hypothetical protein
VESELDQSYYAILVLQGSMTGPVDYQLAAFSRYYSVNFYIDQSTVEDSCGDSVEDEIADGIETDAEGVLRA